MCGILGKIILFNRVVAQNLQHKINNQAHGKSNELGRFFLIYLLVIDSLRLKYFRKSGNESDH